ncbi:MAG: fructosamine kinase family protein [Flammeovirgaceae bacterium]
MPLETDQNQFFESAFFQSTGYNVRIEEIHFESGGCINNALKIKTSKGVFFFKYNIDKPIEMFEKEARGLNLLKENFSLTVPTVVGYGKIMEKSYLILEYIQSRFPQKNYWQKLGESLAELHKKNISELFGLQYDNFIGSIPQQNQPMTDNWEEFFVEKRLRNAFGRAFYHGLIDESYMRLLDRLSEKIQKNKYAFFEPCAPSLLHGDLWSGNVMPDEKGNPCIYDPAIYFGNREIEIAFTRLFGGFEEDFYDAYCSCFPMNKGFREREALLNLYPLMIHVNLFGTGYLRGVKETLTKFVF